MVKNGNSAALPPTASTATSPQYMTMNGNKPAPKEESMLGPSSSTTSNARQSTSAAAAASASINTETAKQRHRHHSHNSKDKSDNSFNNNSVGLSGGSPADNDSTYCTEIARRSVARAALHLGMEGMEGEALDVLGSMLLGYMDMVGTTISANVETSGRSSAHSNAYDALNAIVDCTAPAATQLGSARASESGQRPLLGDNNPSHSRLKEVQERGWEGLATFLFGSDWFSIPLEGEDEAAETALGSSKEASSVLGKDSKLLQTNGKANMVNTKKPGGKTILPSRPVGSGDKKSAMAASTKTSGKGKQLNNMQGSEKAVSFSLERKPSVGAGRTDPSGDGPGTDGSGPMDNDLLGRWNAPYLNDIPAFPLVTNTKDVANPHRLPTSLSLSMHDLATEMEACRETQTLSAAKRLRKGSAASNNNKDDKEARAQIMTKVERLKEEAAEKAIWASLRIPDDVYATVGTVWGSLQDGAGQTKSVKKKTGPTDGDKKPAAADPRKPSGKEDSKAADSKTKVKFDPALPKEPPSTNTSSLPVLGSVSSNQRPAMHMRPPYVPNFLPPFPSDTLSDAAQDRLAASASNIIGDVVSQMYHREKRKASALTAPSAADEEKAAATERDAVRRSVIGLGKSAGPSYWGSKWLEEDEDGKEKHNASNNKIGANLSDVTVAPGEGGTAPSSSAKKSSSDTSHVLPLGRASGSRLSKILEGSMNVS